MTTGIKYPPGHWIRDASPRQGLEQYLGQQRLTYSRIKNRFVQDLLGDLTGKTFLDYGCGGGFFLIHAVHSKARLVMGVDAEENVLATARFFLDRQGAAGPVHLIRSDQFPAFRPETKFDVILMKDVIEHVPDDLGLVRAAASVLAPGGRMVLSTQNALSLNCLIQGTWNRRVRNNKAWLGWDPTHLRFYTPNRLKRILASAGLACRGWRASYLIPYKWPAPRFLKRQFVRVDFLSVADRALGACFPFNRLGWNVAVLAVSDEKG
ncbi:MAG: methyltransferase domain-containing protein [Proteobacteria bacterium]|nr:methyltransferase domain-containing protein [Pseudomonadota bacterium]